MSVYDVQLTQLDATPSEARNCPQAETRLEDTFQTPNADLPYFGLDSEGSYSS